MTNFTQFDNFIFNLARLETADTQYITFVFDLAVNMHVPTEITEDILVFFIRVFRLDAKGKTTRHYTQYGIWSCVYFQL